MPPIVLTGTTRTSVVYRCSLAAPYPTTSQPAARYARLLKLCRARGCPREDAKELVQEAYLRLFQCLRSTKVRDVDSLLRRIVINLSINYYHRELLTPHVFESIDKLDRHSMLPSPNPGPERTVAAEQYLNSTASLLCAVSPRTCQIFIAQRAGYSYEEVAIAFAVKPRTIEKHVATATTILMEVNITPRDGGDMRCPPPPGPCSLGARRARRS